MLDIINHSRRMIFINSSEAIMTPNAAIQSLREMTADLQRDNDIAELKQELRDAWHRYKMSVSQMQENLPPQGDARWSAHHKTHLILAEYLKVRARCKTEGILDERAILGDDFSLAVDYGTGDFSRVEVYTK